MHLKSPQLCSVTLPIYHPQRSVLIDVRSHRLHNPKRVVLQSPTRKNDWFGYSDHKHALARICRNRYGRRANKSKDFLLIDIDCTRFRRFQHLCFVLLFVMVSWQQLAFVNSDIQGSFHRPILIDNGSEMCVGIEW
jgi:hypothetical protein